MTRAMRSTAVLFFASAGAAVVHPAWAQNAERWAPAAYFASSDERPPAARPSPDRWPDRGDLPALLDDRDLDRWIAQAKAGRAQAAINAGDHMIVRSSQARGNCRSAIDWYREAEALGSDQAAGRLGGAYADDTCPQQNLATAIEYWRKALELGNRDAARVLSRHLAEEGSRHYDPVGALAYAEVAADTPEAWRYSANPQPADPAELAAKLGATQIEDARRIADAARAAIRARDTSFAIEPRSETLLRREFEPGRVHLSAIDDLRECERNLIGNCRGVRRLAYADVSNTSDEYLRCSFAIRGTPAVARETVVPPQTARYLRLGRIAGTPAEGEISADCDPLRGFAAAVERGTCIAQPTAPFDVASMYPPRALRAEIEGRVSIYVLMNEREGRPVLVEAIRSDSALLETAALDAARDMIYRADCDAAYRAFAIEFQLAD